MSFRHSTLRLFLTAAILGATVVACTRQAATPPDDFDDQVAMLHLLTEVEGAHAGPPSVVEHGHLSRRVTWHVDTDSTWDRYRTAVTARLMSASDFRDFRAVPSPDGSLTLARTLPGDIYTVRIEPSGDTPSQVVATFTATAD
jgi:hypothetical protein